MADDEPPSTEQPRAEAGELVLFVTAGDVRPNVLGAVVFLALVVGDGWTSALLLCHHTGAVLHAGVAAAVVIGLPALWLGNRHIARIGSWLRWRKRPLPAMRLTASGLDYSPAYTGDFPLHVDWWPMLESRYRRGPDNTGFFWCLYSPIINGIDPLPPFVAREWPLEAHRVKAELRDLIRTADMDKHSPEQMAAALHLIYYGTPIALNPYSVSGAPISAIDTYLRERTDGRCTLQPPDKRIPPTTRFRTFIF
ncbi:hypothetical protein [Streptomyces sp. 3214.6]|uniref:hypothetical protein n=1 Tax=Streptomyces sp. 3214.6 TaxID=1882757 RepID=UPI00090CD4FB|nr:hypothetical protein [Streptomyces sp. 3214.6]SHH37180.1 hypothetical protein SAMN05444521_0281 [Streptomyces sp. 3214.6]